MVVIEKESALGGKHEAFKQELSKHPGVISAGRSTAVPGISWGSATFLPEGAASNGQPMKFYFLDDDLEMKYKSEQKMGQIFSVFSIVAIFIACLGLFGLVSFTAFKN